MKNAYFDWELRDEEFQQLAGGTAATLKEAEAEARHYTMMYAQDGPVECEVRRIVVMAKWKAGNA